jgi:transcriptional regulator with XRE-family HTH domain
VKHLLGISSTGVLTRLCQEVDVATEDISAAPLGQRIRELRAVRGLTLTALAEEAGLSTGLISQVERGLSDPSLETLRRVAKVLDVPIFSLFQRDGGTAVQVVRWNRRMKDKSLDHDIVYSRISPGRGRLEMLHGHLGPGSASAAEPWSHPSEECVLVLCGAMIVEVAGEEYELGKGDSCYLDSGLPHRYRNPHATPAEFIVSVTPPSY